MRRLLFLFVIASTALVEACGGPDRATSTGAVPAGHAVRANVQSTASSTPPPATFEITGVEAATRSSTRKVRTQDAVPVVCPTGIKHCGYPGDAIIAQGEDTYNGGDPLYWFTQTPLPSGVTSVTFDPNPTSGIAPNAVQITIQTASTIAPGTYSFGIFESFSADGSNPNVPVPLTFEICDPVSNTCPTAAATPTPTPTPTSTPTPSATSTPTAVPSPPPPATAPPYPYTPDTTTDAASGDCANPSVFCIIQGSQESIYYVSESCGAIFPGICYSFTSSYSVSGVPDRMIFAFNPASLPGNYQTTLTLRADEKLAPGSYPITITKTVADGRQPASQTVTIQVLCSVRLSTCENPAPDDAVYTCFPDLEPILETGTGIFAKRRAAESTSLDLVYMSRMSDGTCPSRVDIYGSQTVDGASAYTFDQPYGSSSDLDTDAATRSLPQHSRHSNSDSRGNRRTQDVPGASVSGTCDFPTNAVTSTRGEIQYSVNASCVASPGQNVPLLKSIDFKISKFDVNSLDTETGSPVTQSYPCSGSATCNMSAPEIYKIDVGKTFVYRIYVTGSFTNAIALFKHPYLGQEIPYNSSGNAYPVIYPDGWGGSTKVPFPDDLRSFVYCGTGSTAPEGACVDRGPIKTFYTVTINDNYMPPRTVPRPLSNYEDHHIHPLCWGGDESGTNGVFLTRSSTGGQHAMFNKWWRSFLTGCPAPSPSQLPD